MATAHDTLKIDISASYNEPIRSIKLPNYKTQIAIGGEHGIVCRVEKRFNWFQKKMMRWCFGWEVIDI